jgi:hypothetical protein
MEGQRLPLEKVAKAVTDQSVKTAATDKIVVSARTTVATSRAKATRKVANAKVEASLSPEMKLVVGATAVVADATVMAVGSPSVTSKAKATTRPPTPVK